jgi:hypothetical protein
LPPNFLPFKAFFAAKEAVQSEYSKNTYKRNQHHIQTTEFGLRITSQTPFVRENSVRPEISRCMKFVTHALHIFSHTHTLKRSYMPDMLAELRTQMHRR